MFDKKSPKGIYNAEELKARVQDGTIIWTLLNIRGRGPVEVIGPITITGISDRALTVTGHYIESAYISDLVSPDHGVFLTAEDAQEHFERFSRACVEDPELREELAQERDEDALFDSMCDRMHGSHELS